MPVQFIAGFFLAIFISLAAWRAHSLSRSGAAAAAVLGTIVFGLGGVPWSVLLLGFFISSSGLSRLAGKRKAALNEKFSKGSERDAAQVAANGGISGLFVLLHLFFPAAVWPWLAFAGTLAAVNADTWATELGVLSRAVPRLITTGAPVERGSSGGITLTGSLAAAGGALFVGLLALLVWDAALWGALSVVRAGLVLALITLGGLAASLVDSLLGATLQAIYHCPVCVKETERHPLHTCGSFTTQLRGLKWMDNDWVNTLCALSGGVIALLGGLVL